MLEAAVQAGQVASQSVGCGAAFDRRGHCIDQHGQRCNTRELVLQRARLAKQAGLDGVVASVEEAACYPSGIRP